MLNGRMLLKKFWFRTGDIDEFSNALYRLELGDQALEGSKKLVSQQGHVRGCPPYLAITREELVVQVHVGISPSEMNGIGQELFHE